VIPLQAWLSTSSGFSAYVEENGRRTPSILDQLAYTSTTIIQHVGYPPSPPLVIKTSFLARHVSILFNHFQVRFYIKHEADCAQQQQTLVMFPCIVTSYE
jgi:hypothetical protein